MKRAYAQGDVRAHIRRPAGGIDFVYRLFSDSHNIVKLYERGILTPAPLTSMPKIYIRRAVNVPREIARLLAKQKANAAVHSIDPTT